jgi:hypothetical protein
MNAPTDENKQALFDKCAEFIEKNEISCGESIYQCDHVITNAYEFIHSICEIVGYKEYEEDRA